MTSTPGVTELRNTVLLRPTAPDPTSHLRKDGELWVDSESLQMYVFSSDIDSNGTPGWIGVTSGQNTGSIIYSGDNPPTLGEIYPNLEQYADLPIEPLPGTCWYDTKNNLLKVWYVTPNPVPVIDDDGNSVDAYTGNWISVTTAHYLTEATASLVNDLQSQVNLLTEQVAELESIINP